MKSTHALKPLSAKRILITTDFSKFSQMAFPLAKAMLAKGGRIKLLYVEPPVYSAAVAGPEMEIPIYDAAATRNAAEVARKHVLSLLKSFRGVKIEAQVHPGGRVAKEIIREAKRWRADLICLTTHGRSTFQRMLFGSVAMKVLTHTKGRVLLFRPGLGSKA